MFPLQDLLARKNTRLHHHLQHLGADMSLLATDWFLCLYTTALPPPTALRVWDSLLLEGPKVLYRVALAILAAVGPALLRIDNAGVGNAWCTCDTHTVAVNVSNCWSTSNIGQAYTVDVQLQRSSWVVYCHRGSADAHQAVHRTAARP